MTQGQFIEALQKGYAKNVEISRAKNSDYAAGDDAFKNFRACEAFGFTVAEGILIRMTDKMARIGSLLDSPAAVKDESISDTLSDLANYAMILKVYLDNEKKSTQEAK